MPRRQHRCIVLHAPILRSRPERQRVSAGDAAAAPRDTPAHAGLRRFRASASDIEMEILSSGELANLTNREADVAIRVVYDRKTLPLNLHGLKGPELFGGVYMSRDRLAAWRAGAPDPVRWIVISIHGIPDWASEGEVRTTGVPFRITDAGAQIAAVRQGLGITTLPCFIGDADPLLVRVPGADLHIYGTLWLLTQGETRKTKRVRLFTEFVSRRLAGYAPLLAGLSISRD